MSTPSLKLRAVQLRHRWQPRLNWIVGVIGVGMLLGGVVVLFTTDQSARSGFLLTLGLVLVLVALLGGRIQLEGFEILGAKVRVREVVKRRLELAESPGRDQGADGAELRDQAVVLQKLVGLYGLYEHIRRMEPPGDERTETLTSLPCACRRSEGRPEFEPAEVMGWFHEGTDALRVIALNLMLANKKYRDFVAVLETVDMPHSLFEQYYGIELAKKMLPDLDDLQRGLLADAPTRARGKPDGSGVTMT